MRAGQLCALAPVSPFSNLFILERAGTNKHGSAMWSVACSCGITVTSAAKHIRRGSVRCAVCNPPGAEQMAAIRAVMPASYARIIFQTKLTRPQIEPRLRWMREHGMCHIGGWARPKAQGLFAPIFHAGAGEDVPCELQPRDKADVKRKHAQRVKKAVAVALAGGKQDPRYLRHIVRKQAFATVKRARAEPHTWLSALFQPAKQEGSAC